MIKQKDGIHLNLNDRIVIDSRKSTGDFNIVSHAHTDHMNQGNRTNIICSHLTSKLAEKRTGKKYIRTEKENIKLLESGHILGSRAVMVKGDEDILYTGDVSTSKRAYMEGFKPVEADKLVVESTYGIPSYSLPEQEEVVEKTKEYLEDNNGPFLMFGYSLGKAQKLNYIANRAGIEKVVVHGSVEKMNRTVEEHSEIELEYSSYTEEKDSIDEETAVILPSSSSTSDWVNSLKEKSGGVKLGFSGWAVNESFKHRGGYDKTFPLSDHCGFHDLVELVKEVDPEKVYTQHGFDEAFASHLRMEHGYNAQALKKNQSSLEEFSP